jgi:[ribosomal protein S5]-alanine N-acetyltransferase
VTPGQIGYASRMKATPIPILRSSRLTLRALCEADYAGLVALAHDPEVARYLHEGPPPSSEDVANRVAGALRQWELRGYGMMAVEDAEGFVGRLGVYHPAEAVDPLLVYALCRKGWGKGYATEGVGLFLNWMSVHHGRRHLLAQIDPRNKASMRVATKFGAIRTGAISRGDSLLDVWSLAL